MSDLRPDSAELARWLRFAGAALGVAGLVWLAAWVAPHLALAPRLAFGVAYGAVALEIVVLSALAPVARPRLLVPALALALAGLVALHGAPATGGRAGLLSAALGFGVALVGAALGGRIEKPGQLAAVALVSALADLWSVFDPTAPSARLADETLARPDRLVAFALPFPLLGTSIVSAIIGAGDVLFAALYVAAFRAHGLAVARVTTALLVGFAAGLAGLLLFERPLPLLPLLGAAVVASHTAARSLSGREWRTVGMVCAALLGAIALRVVR